MSREIVSDACFLCGSPSEYYEFDFEKRRHYRCSGSACGEYVITDTARGQLANNERWREEAAAFAKRVADEKKILEIWVNPATKVLEAHQVER